MRIDGKRDIEDAPTYLLGGGVVLREATSADWLELNERMRPADRAELAVFGMRREDPANWERAWAVFLKGALIGVIGFVTPCGFGPLSTVRYMGFMSTDAVDRAKVGFVRATPRVARFYEANLPAWVDTVVSIPMASYRGSVEWQRRVLGFERTGEVEINGTPHAVLAVARETLRGADGRRRRARKESGQ